MHLTRLDFPKSKTKVDNDWHTCVFLCPELDPAPPFPSTRSWRNLTLCDRKFSCCFGFSNVADIVEALPPKESADTANAAMSRAAILGPPLRNATDAAPKRTGDAPPDARPTIAAPTGCGDRTPGMGRPPRPLGPEARERRRAGASAQVSASARGGGAKNVYVCVCVCLAAILPKSVEDPPFGVVAEMLRQLMANSCACRLPASRCGHMCSASMWRIAVVSSASALLKTLGAPSLELGIVLHIVAYSRANAVFRHIGAPADPTTGDRNALRGPQASVEC